jgi:hypothetical protein
MRLLPRFRISLTLLLIAATALGLPLWSPRAASSTTAQRSDSSPQESFALIPEAGEFILYEEHGRIACREASLEEARRMAHRELDAPTQTLAARETAPDQASANSGLNIILRGTAQLNNFPAARDAFIRAANTWRNFIHTPITIVIDVDFGPTRFGIPYPASVLGSTGTQGLLGTGIFTAVRNSLVQNSIGTPRSALYDLLPVASVPTDLGLTSNVLGPSAVFRALGLIPAVADPAAEQRIFGSPPSIGFNSNFIFDFDPSDGIDPDKIDFDAVAVHEIGHALGFASNVGLRELIPTFPAGVSFWDLFRFRPGNSTLAALPFLTRVQSSGGDQIFFAGQGELGLSTGRPNGTGGDGRQASHWKADELTTHFIGVMDPTLARGVRQTITHHDLAVLEAIGYQLSAEAAKLPVITDLSAELDGDALSISGTATDGGADLRAAQVAIYDARNRLLAITSSFAVNFSAGTTSNFAFRLVGLDFFPTAVRATMTAIDGGGNLSASAAADFSLGEPGGPHISRATHTFHGLFIKGENFTGHLELEINGVLLSPRLKLNVDVTGSVLRAAGSLSALNLRAGANRIRVFRNGRHSNIFVLTI